MPRSDKSQAQRGFTLLEVMVTIGLIGVVLLPILTVREQATNRAYRSKYMLLALHHAQELLAEHGREIEPIDKYEGRVEEENSLRYVITFEDWDLATGRSEDEMLEEDPFANDFGAIPPSDAVAEEEEEDINDPHRVRRFSIKVYYPDVEEVDQEQMVALEGFLPRMWERDSGFLDINDNETR
ncbi:MAG: type II secretion system protein [Planctomycetota bacterium]|nr:type II secretion system protein [Planctomycetota bacterium]